MSSSTHGSYHLTSLEVRMWQSLQNEEKPYSVGFLRHLLLGLWLWRGSCVDVHDAEKWILYSDAEMVSSRSSARLEIGEEGRGLRSRVDMACRGNRCSGTHVYQTYIY